MKTLFVSIVLLMTACQSALAGEITVSAAASLSNAFNEIARNYEAMYPGAKVAMNFSASGTLLQQIAKGAPVDVLATADQETMDLAAKQGLLMAGERRNFAGNTLVVVVPFKSGNAIKRLEDLGLPSIKRIAIGLPASVPAGRYTRQALDKSMLWSAVELTAIHTQNVRQALDYVARGEVDAGFVYSTDAQLMPAKVRTAFAVPVDPPILYPISVLSRSRNSDEAKRFAAYLMSAAGQLVMAKYGFGKP
jgi:molybdate transport system substrate-binding protein